VELCEVMNTFKEQIHREEISHFTTPQKFGRYLNSMTLNRILHRLMKMFYDYRKKIDYTVLDSSELPIVTAAITIYGEPWKHESGS